jgi:hypothetical protein
MLYICIQPMYGPIIALHKHDRRLDRSSDRDLLKLLFDEYDSYTFSVEQEVRLKELLSFWKILTCTTALEYDNGLDRHS